MPNTVRNNCAINFIGESYSTLIFEENKIQIIDVRTKNPNYKACIVTAKSINIVRYDV